MKTESWTYLRDALYDLAYMFESDKDASIYNREIVRILNEYQELEGVL